MQNCIYCNSTGPFNKEHVFPYFLGGGGDGWTLIDTVCEDCNNMFSTLELALARQSIESIPRTFHGPTGRKSQKKEKQVPLYAEDLYCLFSNDDILYEGGLELGFYPYVRPQIIANSLPHIVLTSSDKITIEKLLDRIKQFAEKDFFVVTKTPTKKGESFELIKLGLESENVLITNTIESNKPKGAWFKQFPENFDTKGRTFKSRIYLDDYNKLIIKSVDIPTAIRFIATLLKLIYNKKEFAKSLQVIEKQEVQKDKAQILVRMSVKLELIFRAIAKIGLNFAAKIYGNDFILRPEFNETKEFILGNLHNTFEESGLHVKLVDANKSPFTQISLSDDKHYIYLSYNDTTGMVFGLNLYGGTEGYIAKLGNINPPTGKRSFQFAIVSYSERKIELLT